MTVRQALVTLALIVVGIPAAAAVLYVLDLAAGTGWALPIGAMVLLLAFLLDFGINKTAAKGRSL